jgi:hypothetical protein
MASEVLKKACVLVDFPILKETQFRIEKYINAASDTLLSDDEMQIYDFLQIHLDSIFQNLLQLKPELKKVINDYFRRWTQHVKSFTTTASSTRTASPASTMRWTALSTRSNRRCRKFTRIILNGISPMAWSSISM